MYCFKQYLHLSDTLSTLIGPCKVQNQNKTETERNETDRNEPKQIEPKQIETKQIQT